MKPIDDQKVWIYVRPVMRTAESPSTSWSLIMNAAQSEVAAALEQFCIVYWPPVFSFIRAQTGNREDAEDLTQSFFTKLVEKHYLAMVSPNRGRFRSFLYAAVRHFLSNERDWARAQKRGGGRKNLSLSIRDSDDWHPIDPAGGLDPEKEFERRWARLIFDRAFSRLRDQQEAAGSLDRYEVLKAFLSSEGEDLEIREAAERLGMNEPAVRMAIHRLRARFAAALRAEVSETLASPSEVDDEIRHLLAILS